MRAGTLKLLGAHNQVLQAGRDGAAGQGQWTRRQAGKVAMRQKVREKEGCVIVRSAA